MFFFSDIYKLIITYLPGKRGYAMRRKYYKKRLKFMGKNVKIDTGVFFNNPNLVSIGDNSWIDKNVLIYSGLYSDTGRETIFLKNSRFRGKKGEVFIGKNVHIAPYCQISGMFSGLYIADNCGIGGSTKIHATASHYRSIRQPDNQEISFGSANPHKKQCVVSGAIQIDENVGIAVNVVIFPGVNIQKNSFIGINSIIKNPKYDTNTLVSLKQELLFSKRFIEKK